MKKPLSFMKPGESGKIVSISPEMRSYKQFADLGIVKGTSLSLKRIAPLGDPIEVKIKGYSLSLRKEEAVNVIVEIDKHNSSLISLTFAPAETALTVISISGGHEFQRKIAALGIYPDENIEIVERHGQGALVINVKGTRLAIGQGMSKKIKVKVVQ